MRYRTLGSTGIQVSTLALGAMNFGALGRTTQSEVDEIVDLALDSGINLIDTADVYSKGESEELLGRSLANRRDQVVLATKGGLPMGEDRNDRGASRRWLTRAVEGSLQRLGVDHIDLYQIHRWDPLTSDEETLSALTDLRAAGKILHFGSSTYPADRIVSARWTASRTGTGAFVTEQTNYSILQRGVEAHVLPVVAEHDMGVLAWSPLASGWLSGAVREDREIATSRSSFMAHRFDTSVPANRAKMDAVEKVARLAEQSGLTMIELALGFVTSHPAISSALIGPRTVDHLESQLRAADLELSEDVLDALDEIVAPGVDLAPGEKNDSPPSVLDARLRRRH